MTPRNPLDDKVIIDRDTSAMLFEIAQQYRSSLDLTDTLTVTEYALAADLTGWVAVRDVIPKKLLRKRDPDNDPMHIMYQAMLAASPPLPGGGE